MTPRFAVVGHPNKGKSSIVATLAQNDSISISTQSGTTHVCQSVDIIVGDASYTLIDTPGFQRPTKALAWLQTQSPSADQRANVVRQFLNDKDCQRQFPDEVELLTPIINGAAILYVVDGSRPYGEEYEAEMEILRWTGQASIALINPIENEDYVEQWQQALGQYFKIVRVFNAMEAELDKQLAVLQSLAHIKEDWQEQIGRIIEQSMLRAKKRKLDKAELAATLLFEACSFELTQKTLSKEQAQALKPTLEASYFAKLQAIETSHLESLKSLLAYHHLKSDAGALPHIDELFDTEKWIAWGLTKQQLTVAAAMAGAAAGAIVDLALAGSSLLLGAASGSAIGAASAWLGADKLATFSLEGLPLGGYVAKQGPMNNKNFPYVLLGRFLYLDEKLSQRTHAQRDSIKIEEGTLQEKINQLSKSQQQLLHSSLNKLSKQKPVEKLTEAILPLLR